jgi:hypothetical protein
MTTATVSKYVYQRDTGNLYLGGQNFHWDGKHGSACASDLGLPPGVVPSSVSVSSQRTGNVLTFKRVASHQIEGVMFYRIGDFSVTIFNT